MTAAGQQEVRFERFARQRPGIQEALHLVAVEQPNALVNLGVSRSRLSAAGFGETRRFAYITSAEGRQENRRVNIIFDLPN